MQIDRGGNDGVSGHGMRGVRRRLPLPDRVVTLALGSTREDSVSDTLRQHVALVHTASVDECRRMLASEGNPCVILRVPSAAEEALVSQLLNLHCQFPHARYVALHDSATSDSRWVLRLGGAGVTELVLCAPRVPADALLAALSRCETDTVAVRVWRQAGLNVADVVTSVLKPAIRLAHSQITLQRFAAAAGMHERSLRKYCEHHGLPSPQWIIGWARLLMAAYYLEEPGRTIQQVSELLDFHSPAAFGNANRRYTGLTLSQLRQTGPVATVSRMLAAAVARGPRHEQRRAVGESLGRPSRLLALEPGDGAANGAPTRAD